ncbi:hypothetical protein [Reyranella sp.]|uniref:hypothetical protein n=1 Tax=Reyranella sp. TaxID=1929291 RepID=UPI003F6FF3E7
MSSLLLFRVTAVAVVGAGIVMTLAGGATSVWAWTTPDTYLAFRVGLPIATAWLVYTMLRLALALPQAWKGEEARQPASDPLTALESARTDAADAWVRKSAPEAVSVRQVPLPREPEPRRRRRVAQRVELHGGRVLYRVVPARPRPSAADRAPPRGRRDGGARVPHALLRAGPDRPRGRELDRVTFPRA